MPYGIRQKLGALGLDLPRFEWQLHRNWTLIRNRFESLEVAPDGLGARCSWQWTSDLHLVKVFPSTGRRLLRRALQEWPVRSSDARPNQSDAPKVSFIIGHRGAARLPHLLAIIRTIAAQTGIDFECIVVEQSCEPEAIGSLPSWVRHVHTKPPNDAMPYSRSWALNCGARAAKGQLLVFHDGDMLVPDRYAAEAWRRFIEGYEIINLKRFVFYLDESQTVTYFKTGALDRDASLEAVVQNLEAGGSIAVGRDAFVALGGFDESFVGWGGEDNEFWERATTRQAWSYGYLPLIHLWHGAQFGKFDPANPNLLRYRERATLDPMRRIEELRMHEFGKVP